MTKGDPMPRFTVLSVLFRRFGGGGALDNVTDVLTARAQTDAEIAWFEARVARVAPVARMARAA
jgi:hypothetical protein